MKSVLVFYRIDSDLIFDLAINDIWTDFVIAKAEGVSCSNVYHSELSTEELLTLVKSKDISSKLFSDINSEFETGATVMFVNPVVGNPIDGFLLSNYLSHWSSCDAKPSLINVNLILATKPREYSREYTNERRSNYFDRHDVIFH